jgi:ring-1,2-phenylacetyl-CoA epoxidase subunit PaaE
MATSTGHRVPSFHRLTVAEVRTETDDAVVVTFAVPDELASDYVWAAGQHVTLRLPHADTEVRRTYSICSRPGAPLRVGIKRLPGGVFSSWATTALVPGSSLDVMTPAGSFTAECDPARARHVVAVAAGSGITPVRAIVEEVLEHEPRSRVTLVFVNRAAADAMFLDELADLKDRHLERFALSHVFTREGRDVDVLSGRVDEARLDELVARGVLPADADDLYLCGPGPFVDQVRAAVARHGATPRVHVELFQPAGAPPHVRPTADAAGESSPVAEVTVVLQGRTTTAGVVTGEPVLDAVLRSRPEAPYSCRSGACSTCRALLREGEVDMAVAYGLEADEVAAGYVLTCQAVPRSERLTVDFDA